MKVAIFLSTVLLAGSLAFAQTPVPVVVPVAPEPTTAPAANANQAAQAANIALALKSLQAMKAANEELLRKQTATLQQLDELQKAAEQLRIYSKRG